jgi:hypothetical protein
MGSDGNGPERDREDKITRLLADVHAGGMEDYLEGRRSDCVEGETDELEHQAQVTADYLSSPSSGLRPVGADDLGEIPKLQRPLFQTPFEGLAREQGVSVEEFKRRLRVRDNEPMKASDKKLPSIGLAYASIIFGSIVVSVMLLVLPVALVSTTVHSASTFLLIQFLLIGPLTLLMFVFGLTLVINGIQANWQRSRSLSIAIPIIIYFIAGLCSIPLYLTSFS